LKEKEAAEKARLECYDFSKEYAAITLNMAEEAKLIAEEAFKNGNCNKAKKYFIIAEDILNELIKAERIKEEIFDKIKNNSCYKKEDIISQLQDNISTGDKYFKLILMYYSKGDFFEARGLNNLPTKYYEKALEAFSDPQLSPCK